MRTSVITMVHLHVEMGRMGRKVTYGHSHSSIGNLKTNNTRIPPFPDRKGTLMVGFT